VSGGTSCATPNLLWVAIVTARGMAGERAPVKQDGTRNRTKNRAHPMRRAMPRISGLQLVGLVEPRVHHGRPFGDLAQVAFCASVTEVYPCTYLGPCSPPAPWRCPPPVFCPRSGLGSCRRSAR
jgi:hypothetical protein